MSGVCGCRGNIHRGPTTIKGEIGRDNAQPGKKEKKNKTDMEKEPMMRKGATADTGMAGRNGTGITWLRKRGEWFRQVLISKQASLAQRACKHSHCQYMPHTARRMNSFGQ